MLSSSAGSSAASPGQLHDAALGHLRSRQISQAESLLEQLRAAHSDTVYPELLQGHLALLSRGDAGAAEALYRRCADLRRRPPSERAAVHHSLARLCRMGERWEEASSLYEAAAALEPSGELEQERLFAAGKLALLRAAPDAASAPLPAGLGCAQPSGAATFAASSATRAGCAATSTPPPPTTRTRRCQNWRSATASARSPSTTSAARRRSRRARCAPPPPPSSARARRRRRRRRRPPTRSCAWRAREGLAALGEVDGGGGAAVLFGPERAAPSAAAYAKAVAVDPTSAAAYEGLGRALLGVPRVGNFGARSPPAPSAPTRRRRRCAPRSR